MTIAVRPVSWAYLAQLRNLFAIALASDFGYFPQSYHRAVLAQNQLYHFVIAWLKPSRVLLGAYEGNQLVGYSISDCHSDGAFLFWIYLAPRLRGQGVGRELLAATEAACQRCGAAHLQLATHDHQDYYQRQGFRLVDTVTESDQQVPMQIMEKSLA